MTSTSEPEAPRQGGDRPSRRRRLREGMEEMIAISAFLVSLASIAIAYQENRASKQLVQASSLPYLSFSTTFNHTQNPEKPEKSTTEVINALTNNGVGPADVRYATMKFNGRNYGDSLELLRDCCGITQPHTVSTLTNQMIRSGTAINFLDVRGGESETAGIKRYAVLLQSNKIDTLVCYCSVFNECWAVKRSGSGRPTSVQECPIARPNEQL